MLGRQAEIVLSAVCLFLSLVAIVLWIPQDSETWMVETFRRQTTLGDAFFPMITAILVALCSALHLATQVRRPKTAEDAPLRADLHALAFLVQLAAIVVVSLAVMYWAGPLAVQLFGQGNGDEPVTYRHMRGTYPFKLLGFALGGFLLVLLTTALVEGRWRPVRVATAVLAVTVLIVVFDLPFDTVLLPPNGDW